MTSRLRDRLTLLGPLAPDIVRGVRAAVATLVPFFLAGKLGHQELVWTALGGWFGTLADPGGTRWSRAKILAMFGVVGSGIVASAALGSSSPVVGTTILALVAFSGSLLRAVGAAASSVGTFLVIVAAIAFGGTVVDPLRGAVAFAAGAAWAIVLSSIVWPVWTHLEMRIALGAAYRAMADYAEALGDVVARSVPEHDPAWASLARTHQRQVRGAIENARTVALSTRARRTGETVLGSNLRTLLGSAETQLPLLVALGEELESMPPAERGPAACQALALLVSTYSEIASTIARRALVASAERPPAVGLSSSEQEGRLVGVLSRRLLESSEAVARIAFAPDTRVEAPGIDHRLTAVARRRLREDLRAIRDALSVRSTFFHHAVRVALAVIVAQLAGYVLSPTHTQWVTVTTIAVLQPYPGATVTRAIERASGTVLGSLVAVAIAFAVHDPLVLALAMVPLSIAGVATRPRSYRLFTFFITPVFLLIAGARHGDWWIAVARAGDAVLGGAIALVFALVFPSREEKRLSVALDTVRRAVREYAEVVVSAQLAGAPASEAVVAGRRQVGISLGVAETSLERLLSEPLRSASEAEDAMLFVTHARRLATAFTTLDAQHVPAADEAPMRAVLAHVLGLLDRARDVVNNPPDLDAVSKPSVRDAFARILRQAELVGSAVDVTAGPRRARPRSRRSPPSRS